MTTESQQQIAREAALECYNGVSASKREAIILSAIDRAHQDGWHEGRDYEAKFGVKPQRSEQLGPLRPEYETLILSQHSEQQEWTALMAKLKREGLLPSHVKEIDNAHNAALAAALQRLNAEREKSRILGNLSDGFRSQLKDRHKLCVDFETKWKSERQRRQT